jgi:hypothetical protein
MSNGEPGAAVDAQGRPVLDPTKNVLDLVEAAITRLDDLNEAYRNRYEMEFRNLVDRMDRETRYTSELRKAEAERINAIRSVDVQALQQATSAAEIRATALATQVSQSAEAMRSQVAAAASASEVSLKSSLEPIQNAIQDLRRAQYEQQGQRAQVVETREVGTGRSQNVGLGIAGAAAAFGVVIGIVAIAVAIILRG